MYVCDPGSHDFMPRKSVSCRLSILSEIQADYSFFTGKFLYIPSEGMRYHRVHEWGKM
jgi:hypothetical protein